MTSVWPSILLRGAQLIFAALIVAVLADTVAFVRIPPPEMETPPAERPPAPAGETTLESFAVIARRNIFHSAGLRAGPPVALSGMLPLTALDLELVGTLFAGEGRKWYSLALVKDARDQVVAVREGQRFAEGRLLLVSIEPRRIVIENGGSLEVLALQSEQDEKGQSRAGLAAGASDAPPSASEDTRVIESLRSKARAPLTLNVR